jgi:uncharacterized sporulation protein YeaH/YhbH (DUF444 family)
LRPRSRREGKFRRIPFIDPIDIRFRRFETVPKPVAQAVMFCLMDVSGSMVRAMKDLAKRFYMLLYVFLTSRTTLRSVFGLRACGSGAAPKPPISL